MRTIVSNPQKRVFIDFGNMTTQEKVNFWCSNFPHDVWFRRKYKIPFLSPQHKAMSFEAIKFEYLENKLIENINRETPNEPQNAQMNEVANEDTQKLIEEISAMDYEDIVKMVNS